MLFLAPNAVMFDKTVFYLLDDVVRDIREVKQELELSLDSYRNDVFFVDRPTRGSPERTDPPFQYPPWELYTDYLYSTVAAEGATTQTASSQCYLIAHRPMVNFYSRDYYERHIETLFGVRPSKILEWDRLVVFQYPRPAVYSRGSGRAATNH